MTRPLASCALLAMALSAHFAAAQTGTIEVDTDVAARVGTGIPRPRNGKSCWSEPASAP